MAISKHTGTIVRSSDFPNIGEYSIKELKEVYDFYEEQRRKGVTVKSIDIQKKFECNTDKARTMLAAAEFKYKLKKKGLV